MWLSPQRRAHSVLNVARVSQIEGGSFSTCGYRLSAAHIRLNELQEFHGLRAVPFQTLALALAPRKFV
eukprot:6122729-Pyramimonas_sp.AAC.1